MKKKIYNALFVSFSFISLTINPAFSAIPKTNLKNALPVYTGSACYPYMSLPELTNTASVIIDAEVIKVNMQHGSPV